MPVYADVDVPSDRFLQLLGGFPIRISRSNVYVHIFHWIDGIQSDLTNKAGLIEFEQDFLDRGFPILALQRSAMSIEHDSSPPLHSSGVLCRVVVGCNQASE